MVAECTEEEKTRTITAEDGTVRNWTVLRQPYVCMKVLYFASLKVY